RWRRSAASATRCRLKIITIAADNSISRVRVAGSPCRWQGSGNRPIATTGPCCLIELDAIPPSPDRSGSATLISKRVVIGERNKHMIEINVIGTASQFEAATAAISDDVLD